MSQTKWELFFTALGTAALSIGAVWVGGSMSDSTAKETAQIQIDQKDHDDRRDAYAKFITEANEYRSTLVAARSASQDKNQDEYTELNEEVRNQSQESYAAAVKVELITDHGQKAMDIHKAYASNHRNAKIDPSNEEKINTAVTKGDELLRELRDIAREELAREKPSIP